MSGLPHCPPGASAPPVHADTAWREGDRLAALARYSVVGTPREPTFDRIASLAAVLLDAPVAVVNFVGEARQYFKAEVGIGVQEMPLDVSICRHVLLEPGVVVVPDLALDPRFARNPLVEAAGGLRFYAGAVLRTPDDLPIGTVCVLDRRPRPAGISDHQCQALEGLAAQVMAELEARRAAVVASEQARLLEMIARGQALDACLTEVTAAIGRLLPGTKACVLLPDRAGDVFAHTVSADVPLSFREKIHGAAIGEFAIGTCGVAVWDGKAVSCPDIAGEGPWAQAWRDLCLAHGFRSVHSEPAIGTDGRALASLALYFPDARALTAVEREGAIFGARIVAIAMERDAATRRIGESEERHRLIVESARDVAIVTMDLDGVVTGWNRGAERLTGYAAAEAIGQPGALVFTDADRAAGVPEQETRRAREEGRAENERWHRRKDGSLFWASGLVAPLRDGHTQGYVTIFADRTRERESAERLRESEARLRLATEAAEVGFWDVDPMADALVWPPRVKAMFGISADAPVSMVDFYAGLHPEDRDAVSAAYAAASDPLRRSLYDVEFRTVGKEDGIIRWVAAKGRGAFDAEGRCIRVIGTAVDITARKETEAALARSRAELQRLNEGLEARVREEIAAREAAQAQLAHVQRMEALGQLAGGIAHDINNVLQAVGGGAALIERRPGDPATVRRLARMVGEAAERGSSVTRRLLAFSRRGDLRAEAVDPVTLLGDMRDILVHTLGAGIGVRVDAAAGLPPILADKGQLETVLVNLAANARDAMDGKGMIGLDAALEQHPQPQAPARSPPLAPGLYVRLVVADSGPGMPPDVLDRATEPFFTTKPQGKGTGLGLAMARGFAEQSGGGLLVESEQGRGTRVSLWFPVAEAMPAGDARAAPRGAEPERMQRILLVDDEALVREITAEGLEAAGFSVVSAGDAAAALDLLGQGEAVDLLVCDLSMPRMDGLGLIREAQRRRPGLPAILLTGFATNAAELAVSGAVAGTFSLLRKPVPPAHLAERISVLLAGAEAGPG